MLSLLSLGNLIQAHGEGTCWIQTEKCYTVYVLFVGFEKTLMGRMLWFKHYSSWEGISKWLSDCCWSVSLNRLLSSNRFMLVYSLCRLWTLSRALGERFRTNKGNYFFMQYMVKSLQALPPDVVLATNLYGFKAVSYTHLTLPTKA